MMRPTPSFKIHTHHYWILFRESLVDQDEVEAANKFFNVTFQHELIPTGSVVIPRYSALPFYQYLEEGIHALGSRLIQDYRQHRFVADMQNWYHHLENVTPKTWFSLEEFGWDNKKLKPDCSFVLKGATNSKKNQWSTHMFAQTVQDVMKVHSNLMQDSLVGDQPIYIRKFVELNPVGTRVDNRPVTEEYRVFILDGKILCKAFYWSEYADVVAPEHQDPKNIPESFLEGILDAIGDEIRFYVVDVARTKSGNWMVVELNDGLQSGLSLCDPEEMYGNLFKGLREDDLTMAANNRCRNVECGTNVGKESNLYCVWCARRLYLEKFEECKLLEPANGIFAEGGYESEGMNYQLAKVVVFGRFGDEELETRAIHTGIPMCDIWDPLSEFCSLLEDEGEFGEVLNEHSRIMYDPTRGDVFLIEIIPENVNSRDELLALMNKALDRVQDEFVHEEEEK